MSRGVILHGKETIVPIGNGLVHADAFRRAWMRQEAIAAVARYFAVDPIHIQVTANAFVLTDEEAS